MSYLGQSQLSVTVMNYNMGNSRNRKKLNKHVPRDSQSLHLRALYSQQIPWVHTWVLNTQFLLPHLLHEASSIAHGCGKATVATEHIVRENKIMCNLSCDGYPIVSGCLELHMLIFFFLSAPLNNVPILEKLSLHLHNQSPQLCARFL